MKKRSLKLMWLVILISLLGNAFMDFMISGTFYILLIIIYVVTFIKNRNNYSSFEIYLCNLWVLIILNMFVHLNFPVNNGSAFDSFYSIVVNITTFMVSILMFMLKSQNLAKVKTNITSKSLVQDIKEATNEVIESSRFILMITLSVYCLFLGIKVIESIPNVLSVAFIIIAVCLLLFFEKRKKTREYFINFKFRYLTVLYQFMLMIVLVPVPAVFFSFPIFVNIFKLL